MKRSARYVFLAAVLVSAVAMVGCPNPVASLDAAPRGAVEVALTGMAPAGMKTVLETDGSGGAPLEGIRAVLVKVLKVEICQVDSGWIEVADFGDAGRIVDLVTLSDDATTLGFEELAPGEYGQIRLTLAADNELVMDTEEGTVTYPLRVPSGVQTGVKLTGGFTVAAVGVTRIRLDFDPGSSVHRTGAGEYLLRPAIHIGEVTTRPYIVNDDFDDYAEGSYPSNWGWYNLWSGAGQIQSR